MKSEYAPDNHELLKPIKSEPPPEHTVDSHSQGNNLTRHYCPTELWVSTEPSNTHICSIILFCMITANTRACLL